MFTIHFLHFFCVILCSVLTSGPQGEHCYLSAGEGASVRVAPHIPIHVCLFGEHGFSGMPTP